MRTTGKGHAPASPDPLSPALTGQVAVVDVNPVADRLRVVTAERQSLRFDMTTGAAVVDGALRLATGRADEVGSLGAGVSGLAVLPYPVPCRRGSRLVLRRRRA